ncbi:MAG: NAD(+) diphosphatase [Gemmatimonadota bacterium]
MSGVPPEHDRGAHPGPAPGEIFAPGVAPPPGLEGPAPHFAFRDDQLLVEGDGAAARIPCAADFAELGIPFTARHYLGHVGGRHCFAVDLTADAAAPEGMTIGGLRGFFGALGEEQFRLAGRAFQVLNWDRTHRYCGRCGTATEPSPVERARTCPACGLAAFPRLSPAIIVLVSRGRELLLARSPRFPKGRYSIIAGFVEPGESLEEAVVRGVREEVAIEVSDIRYFGSQSWPFPHSLMLGFTARYAKGQIQIAEEEIADAGWYAPDRLPDLPDRASISRRIIDAFLASQV